MNETSWTLFTWLFCLHDNEMTIWKWPYVLFALGSFSDSSSLLDNVLKYMFLIEATFYWLRQDETQTPLRGFKVRKALRESSLYIKTYFNCLENMSDTDTRAGPFDSICHQMLLSKGDFWRVNKIDNLKFLKLCQWSFLEPGRLN